MWSGRALRRKKTNLAQSLANSTTLTAPGQYIVPYGANAVLVGGKGSPGNPSTGGEHKGGGNFVPAYYSGYSYTQFHDDKVTAIQGYPHIVSSVGDSAWSHGNTPPSPYTYYNGNQTPGASVVNYTVTAFHPSYYNTEYFYDVVPGNSGPTATIGGVKFPGGASDKAAAPVPPAPSTFTYVQGGITITVPPGGSVTLTPLAK